MALQRRTPTVEAVLVVAGVSEAATLNAPTSVERLEWAVFAVPEPTALALLALGIVGLARSRNGQ